MSLSHLDGGAHDGGAATHPPDTVRTPSDGRTLSLIASPGDPKGVLIKHSAVVAAVANVVHYTKVTAGLPALRSAANFNSVQKRVRCGWTDLPFFDSESFLNVLWGPTKHTDVRPSACHLLVPSRAALGHRVWPGRQHAVVSAPRAHLRQVGRASSSSPCARACTRACTRACLCALCPSARRDYLLFLTALAAPNRPPPPIPHRVAEEMFLHLGASIGYWQVGGRSKIRGLV